MEEWCYDNPDIDDFDEIDYRYYEFFLAASQYPVTVGNNITLLQLQNTPAIPTPYLLSGNNLKEKGIDVERAEMKQSGNNYEVVLDLLGTSDIPDTLQLHALWEDEEDWCDIVDSTQQFTKVGFNKIRFTFKHLSQKFNGFFVLSDPGYRMGSFVPEFVPDYSIKEMDTEALERKITEIEDKIYEKENKKNNTQINNEKIDTPVKEDKALKNEDDIPGYTLFKIGVYLFIILGTLILWLGPGLIKSCKRQREMDQITLGGTRGEANKSIEKYNERIVRLNELTDSIIGKNERLLVFTNDTSMNEAIVRPKLNYRVFEPVSIGWGVVQRNNQIVKEIDRFVSGVDTLGFNVYFKSNGRNIKMAELKASNSQIEFIVLSYYYYSEKEKEILKRRIDRQSSRMFVYPHKSKEKQLAELEELQCSKVILSETELKNQKIEGGLKAMFAPRNGAIGSSHRFYFCVYNTHINRKEFEDNVNRFISMFMKGKKRYGGDVQKIKLRKSI